ncbi:hypothetical protein Prum_004950 [Phytohabitans rumicis]|uniref:Uncharacterized protein n=1 Tax=Phytohabitans rumicis TaxID=1076125 RepID=A0A6V8KNW3_9ACTN|nr:hypothetical protein Prum_004950 [Phytohabitans rumicis]
MQLLTGAAQGAEAGHCGEVLELLNAHDALRRVIGGVAWVIGNAFHGTACAAVAY